MKNLKTRPAILAAQRKAVNTNGAAVILGFANPGLSCLAITA